MTALLTFWTTPASGPLLPFWFILGFLLAVSVASIGRKFLSDRVCGVASGLALLGFLFPSSRTTVGGEVLFEGWLLCLIVAMVWFFRRWEQRAHPR